MFPHQWHLCSTHELRYPCGAMCPHCERELAAREGDALSVHWKDVIPLENQLDFMRYEHVYCRDEEHAFFSYNGSDVNQKEKLRITVLEKRVEFLQLFATIIKNEALLNVHKSEDSN